MPRNNVEHAVVIKNLVRRFGEFIAVNRISFEVRKGEVFGFLGPNGAGKSTTIRMLCGILRPTSGEGKVAGYDLLTQAEEIKSHIGYMSQKFSLYENLTVEENIDFYSGIYRIAPEKKEPRKRWVLEMARLKSYRDTPAGILPGGLKQRLALGCAVLHEPRILFLDEPTSGVDPIHRRRFWDLIYELSGKGVTVFVTTHYLDEAENCNRLALIYRGELIAQGAPGEIKLDLMRGNVWEVRCERPEDAMVELDGLPGIQDVSLFGVTLHVVAEDDTSLAELIENRLREKGFRVERIERIPASLEDAFVSIIRRRDRELTPQEEVRR